MADKEPINASCKCGKLSVDVTTTPILQLVCHCTDCREVTGQPYTEVVFYAPGTFKVQGNGQPTVMKGGSGHDKTYFICQECGTPLYATVEALGGAAGVIASRLSHFKFTPLMHVWTSEKSADTTLPKLSVKFSKAPPKLAGSALRTYVKTLHKVQGQASK